MHNTNPDKLLRKLLAEYGPQGWWPAETDFEILVGAILVQNARWSNVEAAIECLKQSDALTPHAILAVDESRLRDLIRAAGCQSVKARRLRTVSRWFLEEMPGLDANDSGALRRALLSVSGIGPETADVLILYLLRRPAVIADAYTRRIMHRLGVLSAVDAGNYERSRRKLSWMGELAWSDLCEFHALLVQHAKLRCMTRPACAACALRAECRAVGVRGQAR